MADRNSENGKDSKHPVKASDGFMPRNLRVSKKPSQRELQILRAQKLKRGRDGAANEARKTRENQAAKTESQLKEIIRAQLKEHARNSSAAQKSGGDGQSTTKPAKQEAKLDAQSESKNGLKVSLAGGEHMENDQIERVVSPPKKSRKRSRHFPSFMGSRSVHCYKRLNEIDEGTYGVVHRAQDIETGEVVALKKIKMAKSSSGFPITSLREINILMGIDHPNIVGLKEIVVGEDNHSIYMVMEYLDHDVKMLMAQMKQPFRQSEVKTLMRQLLSAVNAMHKGWILHRDLKTSNLLYSNGGVLKVCDFGLARKYSNPVGKYTPLVVTLWYRAPEILLGGKTYTEALDMWSVGCIFAEFLTRKPLMPGKGEIDQLEKIFNLLGTPSSTEWPGFADLPHAKNFQWKKRKNRLREKFPKQSFGGGFYLDDVGFDLLSRLLTFDPSKRISAEEALAHKWFTTAPRPQTLSLMPTFRSANEKSRRKKVRVSKSKDDRKGAN
jgi:cell division cycle 2-like